jgi:hypothetical protein
MKSGRRILDRGKEVWGTCHLAEGGSQFMRRKWLRPVWKKDYTIHHRLEKKKKRHADFHPAICVRERPWVWDPRLAGRIRKIDAFPAFFGESHPAGRKTFPGKRVSFAFPEAYGYNPLSSFRGFCGRTIIL